MFWKPRPPAAKNALDARLQDPAGPAEAPAPLTPPPQERAPRRALYRHGVLLYGAGERLTVAIKNLSATGAKIEFFTHVELPADVTLVEPTLKLRRAAQVVWQGEGVAGLAFV
jgi:hypothetical protein